MVAGPSTANLLLQSCRRQRSTCTDSILPRQDAGRTFRCAVARRFAIIGI